MCVSQPSKFLWTWKQFTEHHTTVTPYFSYPYPHKDKYQIAFYRMNTKIVYNLGLDLRLFELKGKVKATLLDLKTKKEKQAHQERLNFRLLNLTKSVIQT